MEMKPPSGLARLYLDAVLEHDSDAAIDLVVQSVDEGMPVQEALLSVIQPAQYELGRLWERNLITVAQEHFGSGVAQLLIARLYSRFPRSPVTGGRLVTACVDDELHDIGARIVTEFFALAGWDTHYLGGNKTAKAIREAVRDLKADVAAISATMYPHVDTARSVIANLAADVGDDPIVVLVGGQAFNASPDLSTAIGAHGWAPDAEEAVTLAQRLVRVVDEE